MVRVLSVRGSFLLAVLLSAALQAGFIAVQAKCPDTWPVWDLCPTSHDTQCVGAGMKECEQDRAVELRASGDFKAEHYHGIGTEAVLDPESSIPCYYYYPCKWDHFRGKCNKAKGTSTHYSNQLKSVNC